MRSLRPSDPWTIAAVGCLFGGAVLLVVAWYDVSGTANLYQQLPYLVSAGFSGLALIMVGSALVIAGRHDRVERRLAQLLDAISEPVGPGSPASAETPGPLETAVGSLLVVPAGRTYHRPGCLLLHDKQPVAADPSDIASGALTPCPVCDPERSSERS
jgi:hypothetical protein